MQTEIAPSRELVRQPDATRSGQRPNGRRVEFTLNMPQARSAAVAGSFNHWDLKQTPMQKSPSGTWRASIALPPGRYEYRFVVDGQWITDPAASESVQNSFGSTNSILNVQGNG
jgi:1,4-alpha-glucan branching enzyme